MPLIIVRNDITKMSVDAIVNAAKESLLGGGGSGWLHPPCGGAGAAPRVPDAGRLKDWRHPVHLDQSLQGA